MFGHLVPDNADPDVKNKVADVIINSLSPSFKKELESSCTGTEIPPGDVLPLNFSSSQDRFQLSSSLTASTFPSIQVHAFVSSLCAERTGNRQFFKAIRREGKLSNIGVWDVIQYRTSPDCLTDVSFAQILDFIEDPFGLVSALIRPVSIVRHSEMRTAWRIEDPFTTTIRIPSSFPMNHSVRRVAVRHCCTAECKIDRHGILTHSPRGPAKGGDYYVLCRYHGYPPHSG